MEYELCPSQYVTGINGKQVCARRKMSYVADFVYFDNVGKNEVVEDVKGFKTDEYKKKCRLMMVIHGIKIKETY